MSWTEAEVIRDILMAGNVKDSPIYYDGPMMIDGLTYDQFMDKARQERQGKQERQGGKVNMTPLEVMLSNNRNQQYQDALSQGLRGRKDMSYLAMLSGDPTVGAFGGALSGDVEKRVQQRLTEREKKAQRDLTQGYYDQLGRQHKDMMDWRYESLEAQKEAARLKNTLGRIKQPTDQAIKLATEVTTAYDNITKIVGGFQDEFGKGKEGTGSMIPFEGDIANWLGRKAAGSPADQAQANWWGLYQNLYELPQRNKMFGSALTETEKQAWKDANIDPNMPANVIRERLGKLIGIAQNALSKTASQHASVYNPEWVMQTYGPYFQEGSSLPQAGPSSLPQENGGTAQWGDLE